MYVPQLVKTLMRSSHSCRSSPGAGIAIQFLVMYTRVIGAVAKGDLSQTMAIEIEGRPLAGEFLRTARTVNTMVEQLGSFASEVTRVAREVGNGLPPTDRRGRSPFREATQ